MRTTHRHRSGKIAIQAVLILSVLLAFAALAIDRSMLQIRDQEAQDAADAVAHAAASKLDGSAQGMAQARSAANAVAQKNKVGLKPVAFGVASGPTARLELGRWTGGQFVADESDPSVVAAARAQINRNDVPTIFGYPAFGVRYLSVSADAVAVSGGVGEMECPLPLAVPDCALPGSGDICGADLTLNPDGTDAGGWAMLGGSRPSAATIRSAIESCGLGEVDTADTVSLNNGSVNSALGALARAVDSSTVEWDSAELGPLPAQSPRSGVSRYGHVLDSWIIVFEDETDCTNTAYNGTSLAVTGFVRAVVYDVDTSGPIADRHVHAMLGCSVESDGDGGGGGFYGTTVPPRFVQ